MQKINVKVLQKPKTIQTSVKNITPINPAKGTKTILQNGIHNIKEFEFISVNVKPDNLQEKEIEIVSNGKYEVTPDIYYFLSKVKVDVNVQIPNGYIIPEGTLEIKDNGTFDVREFEYVLINVPIPEEYIIPEGKINITNTEEIDVTQYAKAQVVDPNLKAENIAEGKVVLGIEGTFKGGEDLSDATATASDILIGKTAYVGDGKIEGTIEIYDYSNSENIIPEEIVSDLNKYLSRTLEKVSFEGETILGNYIFYGQTNLKEVYLPNVTSQGTEGYQFYNCSSLEKANLGIGSVYGYCFRECRNLKELTTRTITKLSGSYQFYDCRSLEKVNLSDDLTNIPTHCFYNCESLKELNLPNVESIGSYAMYNCESLKELNLPNVVNINSYALDKCISLETVVLGSIAKVEYCLRYCSKLKYVIITKDDPTITIDTRSFVDSKLANIYFLDHLVDQYKIATNWSSFGDRIKGISELPQDIKEKWGLV